jgi:hypothetical protein
MRGLTCTPRSQERYQHTGKRYRADFGFFYPLASFELDVFPLVVLDLQNQIWSIKSYQEIPYDESPSGGTIDRTRA